MHRRDAAYYTRFNGTSHDHEQLTLGCWQLTYQAVQGWYLRYLLVPYSLDLFFYPGIQVTRTVKLR